jgi:hypothetical protein
MKSSARDDIRFFTEVNLLPGKLVLVVAIHPLDASWLIGIPKPNPQRVLHIQHKMGILQAMSNPLE